MPAVTVSVGWVSRSPGSPIAWAHCSSSVALVATAAPTTCWKNAGTRRRARNCRAMSIRQVARKVTSMTIGCAPQSSPRPIETPPLETTTTHRR